MTFTLVRVRLSPWPETAGTEGWLDRVPFSNTVIHTTPSPPRPFSYPPFCFLPLASCNIHSSVSFCQPVLKMDGELAALIPELCTHLPAFSGTALKGHNSPLTAASISPYIYPATGVYSVRNAWLTENLGTAGRYNLLGDKVK